MMIGVLDLAFKIIFAARLGKMHVSIKIQHSPQWIYVSHTDYTSPFWRIRNICNKFYTYFFYYTSYIKKNKAKTASFGTVFALFFPLPSEKHTGKFRKQ